MNQHSNRRFVAIFLLTFAIPTLFVALVNWIIDPFDFYRSPTLQSVNAVKVSLSTQQRLYRSLEMVRQNVDVFFLGSSRVMAGIDPEDFNLLTGKKAYNAGFAGASMEEIYHYFEHLLYHQPNLKTVIVGLDLFGFGKNKKPGVDFSLERLQSGVFSLKSSLSLLFSKSALKSSYETWKENRSEQATPFFLANGLYNHPPVPSKPSGMRLQENFEFLEVLFSSTDVYRYYRLDQEKINCFQKLVQRCQEKGIELRVFISPTQAIYWEALYRKGLWPVLEELKRSLSAIYPIWDFSGFNCVTTSSLEDKQSLYYECSHYKPAVGKMILDKIFNEANAAVDFGYLLTSRTIEDILKNIRADRKQWINAEPALLEAMQTFYPLHD